MDWAQSVPNPLPTRDIATGTRQQSEARKPGKGIKPCGFQWRGGKRRRLYLWQDVRAEATRRPRRSHCSAPRLAYACDVFGRRTRARCPMHNPTALLSMLATNPDGRRRQGVRFTLSDALAVAPAAIPSTAVQLPQGMSQLLGRQHVTRYNLFETERE